MIPSEIIKKIKTLELSTRHIVSNIFSGNYHSIFKGQGISFAELREYQIGDDIRLIDWKNTEKMGTPYIKLFEEERELTVILAIDLSASGLFGSQEKSKRDIILEIAAILGFSAAKNKDKIGLLLFTDHVEHYLPPKKGKNSMLRVLRDIFCFKPIHKKTNIADACNALLKNLKKKSIVFLISDFIDQGFEKNIQQLNKKHDLIPIVIKDPWEGQLPPSLSLRLKDHESDTEATIHSNTTTNEIYQNICNSTELKLQRFFKNNQCHSINIYTEKDYILPLKHYFKYRKQKNHV
ncbi:MAG: DUF58 domain-containing protein [bacterium]